MGAPAASATFPGTNGRIVWLKDGHVASVKPDGSGFRRLTTGASDYMEIADVFARRPVGHLRRADRDAQLRHLAREGRRRASASRDERRDGGLRSVVQPGRSVDPVLARSRRLLRGDLRDEDRRHPSACPVRRCGRPAAPAVQPGRHEDRVRVDARRRTQPAVDHAGATARTRTPSRADPTSTTRRVGVPTASGSCTSRTTS